MMTFAQIKTATLDQLTDELVAAGWDSTQTDVTEAREAVTNLLLEVHRIEVGKRITAGKGEDRDSGRIDVIEGDQVTVAWDSGVVTTQSADALVTA